MQRTYNMNHKFFNPSLNLKGHHQAERNDSEDIWLIFGCQGSSNNCTRTLPLPLDHIKESSSPDQKQRRKSVSFNDQNNQNNFERSVPQQNINQNQPVSFSSSKQKPSNLNNVQSIKLPQTHKKQLSQSQLQQKHKYLKQCYSIEKYLNKIKPYTRTMPNSAMKLFYQKPCLQSYGRKNTSGNNGFIYNDYLKTHNTLPHRYENDPKKYQSYRSALNFGKRTKIDPQDRWKKIHRQMVNKMDMKALVDNFAEGYIQINGTNVDQMLKHNINTLKGQKMKKSKSLDHLNKTQAAQEILNATAYQKSKNNLNSTMATTRQGNNTTRISQDEEIQNERIAKLKRSKSWGKKQYLFLYKYKDQNGNTRFAKDRHGITCYVDPTFQENKQAFTKFLKKVGPIEAEDVRPQDKNIDKVMIQNYLKFKQQEEQIPKHYLMPNCDEPYRPEKYSFKARRQSLKLKN